MFPILNWKEIQEYQKTLTEALCGKFVDRIIIPERSYFSKGYLKDEWALRFDGLVLMISVRPRACAVSLLQGKGSQAAKDATHSPFELELNKRIKGKKLLAIEVPKGERMLIFWFTDGEFEKQGLVLSLFPARPEATLIGYRPKSDPVILAAHRDKETVGKFFELPKKNESSAPKEFHEEWISKPFALSKIIEKELRLEAFSTRLKEIKKHASSEAKKLGKQKEKLLATLDRSQSEPDFSKYGDLLKAVLYAPPPVRKDGKRELTDYETGETILVPCDESLTAQQQVEKFYTLGRRNKRRLEETQLRISDLESRIQRLEKILNSEASDPDFEWIQKLELESGLVIVDGAKFSDEKRKSWPGRSFISKDGFTIWIGRTLTENLDLTFKYSRGNDIWMHLRGRASAHVIIPVPGGKSVPLETLLDAATLLIHTGKGERWGKVEVDYTFRKNVKRIKKSTEVSYTQNKTLLLEHDGARIKRLMGN